MCKFCENIRDGSWYDAIEPYIYMDDEKLNISVRSDGTDCEIRDVKFCPYCGRKLHRRKNKSNVRDVIIALSAELQKHTDLYNAFCASIQSAIRDVPKETRESDLSEHILKRIIGEE